MGIAWIDRIANNTDDEWFLKSVDSGHNGALNGGGDRFTLDDQQFHAIKPRTIYRADWCGVPWFYNFDHFKSISSDQQKEAQFYTSWQDGKNWIVYQDPSNLRLVGRQEVPKDDCHCVLRIEDSGIFIDVINEPQGPGNELVKQINDEVKSWVNVLAPVLAAAITALAKS